MMTSLGKGIATGYLVFVALGLIIAFGVLWSTKRGRREGGQGVDIERAERAEPWWGVFVVVLLAILLGMTIWRAPWFTEGDDPRDVQVKVTGIQFGFLVQPTTVKAGQNVQFNVTSKDVNHAMALFNPQGQMIMNVQAVPEYTISRSYTFTEPGTYTIRCFEFCGYQHHKMIYPAFQVTA
jgi:cytochrome c oxidase subunit 2